MAPMSTDRDRIPLRPDYTGRPSPFTQRAFAVIRGTSSITTTTGATALGSTIVADFVSSLSPICAAARLRGAGVQVTLERNNSVLVPRRSGSKAAADVGWVIEGGPIPFRQYLLDYVTLGPPSTLKLISGMTRELSMHSSCMTALDLLLREDVAGSLDASVFSNAAASGAVPQGLLFGVTPTTATAATRSTSRRNDLPCASVATGTVIAVQADAFVSSIGDAEITLARDAPVHLNTVAAPFSTSGSPNTIAAPMVSSFQSDLVAIKIILDACWAMRAEKRVAVVHSVNWGNAPS